MAQPLVSVIMGSTSDLSTMQHTADMLDELGVPHEIRVVSAHRTPDLMFKFAEEAKDRGIKVIVASAGGAAHLPGMTAAKTVLPVIGVPGVGPHLDGLDSLMSIVQMPRGYPVGTVAIGEWGAVNAGILAAQIIGLIDSSVQENIENRRGRITAEIEETTYVKPEVD
ncbi:MAG: 5-(carboxyamino)imidazole ribonucleotide mutase [SAR202 cluster bacterium]|nr:5-(carboxyamino)imidazole ribonucleotide mutase [Chloroflexota bacterium]MQG88121.1 5-(carboxyamino)imidazole ribonucleotide mutase [SAR202 cluster bacterium]|tara:strand:- start:2063 stop:2563 length:501 start_codon:yes stop_codon:yes gene_type:complete